MRLALGAIHELDEERMLFVKQLGIDEIVVHTPELRGDGYWEFADLVRLRTRAESYGLKIAAIENVPRTFYDRCLKGLPGRDEQIETFHKTLRNIARAGIPCLGYDFVPLSVWRTGFNPVGRGGARVTAYDHHLVENAPIADIGPVSDEEMWERFTYFIKAVVPVAEEEGLVLALHPDDPPVPSIAGVARIFRSFENYKRVIEIIDSPSNCLEFCQGTVAEWSKTADEVYDAIRYFVTRKKIAYVHFRNVSRCVPTFEETFIDEGLVDMFQAMKVYHECGFDGVLIDDHTPAVAGDTPWGHRGRAFIAGYMKAMVKAIEGGCC